MAITIDELIRKLENAKASGIVTGDSLVEASGGLGEISEAYAQDAHPNATGGMWPAVFVTE